MRRVLRALLVLVGLIPATVHAAPAPMYASTDATTDLAGSYVGARYYQSQTGRFTSVDPGHVNGNILDPQSWNGYAYARNNPLKYTDPTGTEYEICAQGAPSCQYVSDQYFAYLQRNPGAGIQLFGGYIYAGRQGVGTYRQTSVDWTFNDFFQQTGRRAEAGFNAALIATSPALALGAGVTVAGAVGAGGLTTLAGEQGVGLLGNNAINQMIGAAQRGLLREMFKTGRIPNGISERTLRLYKELAERAIAEGKDGLGVQAQRLEIIAKALRLIK